MCPARALGDLGCRHELRERAPRSCRPAGRRVGIRIEPAVVMFYDLDSREPLRTRKNPLTAEQVTALKGQRPAGPPP